MKKLLFFPGLLFLLPKQALANPACAVCTIAIGASLEIARKLGLEDSIVGLWAGALLALTGYWTILFFEKRNWNFWGRDPVLIALSVGMIGFIYISRIPYSPKIIWHIFYLDPILFSTILGMALYLYSQKLYQQMKAHHGGRAHFPFEKVVLPVAFLLVTSVYLTCLPL